MISNISPAIIEIFLKLFITEQSGMIFYSILKIKKNVTLR